MKEYKGIPVSEGIAVGKAICFTPFQPDIQVRTISREEIKAEIVRYESALRQAVEELKQAGLQLAESEKDKASLFAAHMEIIDDEVIDEDIRVLIKEMRFPADRAIFSVYNTYIKQFESMDDDLIRERAADMEDVKTRLLRCCQGIPEQDLSCLKEPVVLLARDLFPSDTARLDRQNVLAIVTELGGETSHTAIIARSYEIPAVVGVKGIMEQVSGGEKILVDAITGQVVVAPEETLESHCMARKEKCDAKRKQTKKYLHHQPLTADGVYIDVEVNIESAHDEALKQMECVDGVGLFRTEFLYMGRKTLPSEREQVAAYEKVLKTCGEKPVIIRTLDIGGDKKLESMELPSEENPFLGNRALRLCFDHHDLFKTQVRACLRAGLCGNLWVMFPMVSRLEDIQRAKAVVEEAKQELRGEGIPYGENVKWGIMIEIPSIALIADAVVQEVDFASIGTNDLTQYTLAVDRMNPYLTQYYEKYHPAVFRLIAHVARVFEQHKKPLGVCGELGSDPVAIPVLIGLGIRRFSMNFAAVSRTKMLISRISTADSSTLAQDVLKLAASSEAEQLSRLRFPDGEAE